MTKREFVVFLFLALSLLSGCEIAPLVSLAGGSYQGYTIWKGRESSKYYPYDSKVVCQAVKKSCEHLKLETVITNPVSDNGCTMETKGNYPMEISVSYIEKNIAKVVITIALFGDKEYAELLYGTIGNNIPRITDNVPKTTTKDQNVLY